MNTSLRQKLPFLEISTFFLFIFLLYVGFSVARVKPLWNDEIYSQIRSIEMNSYRNILLGKNGEGNTSPLFYLVQKIFTQVIQYKTPERWQTDKSRWRERDSYGEIVLRITPVTCVSLALTLIFYYFSRFDSLWAGVYSLFIAFCTVMLWRHWAEARPYAVWILLTTVQSLLLLYIAQFRDFDHTWKWMAGVHILMSLLVIFSLGQITAVAFIFWTLGERRWRRFLFLLGIPVFFCIVYYRTGTSSHFFFDLSPEQLVRDNFSRERFYMLVIFLFYLVLYYLQKRFPSLVFYENSTILQGIPYWSYSVIVLFSAAAILVLFYINSIRSPLEANAPVASRYFVNLVPIGIIATTYITSHLLRSVKGRLWMQAVVAVGIGYLVIHRFTRVAPELKSLFPEIFFFSYN